MGALLLVLLAVTWPGNQKHLTGTVLDFDTGMPIAGVAVSERHTGWAIIPGDGSSSVTRGKTNRDGRFKLDYTSRYEPSVAFAASSKGYSRFDCWYEHDRDVVVRLRKRISGYRRLPTGFIRLRLTKDGKLYGWNFSEARMTASEDSADIFPTFTDSGPWGGLRVKALGKGGVRFVSQGVLQVDNMFLTYADTAPLTGYRSTAEMSFHSKGGIYFVRTRDGSHYAKVEFNAHRYRGSSDMTPDVQREVDLQYVYNDRGSRDLRSQYPW